MNTPVVIGDAKLWLGDCLEVLPTLAAESIMRVLQRDGCVRIMPPGDPFGGGWATAN